MYSNISVCVCMYGVRFAPSHSFEKFSSTFFFFSVILFSHFIRFPGNFSANSCAECMKPSQPFFQTSNFRWNTSKIMYRTDGPVGRSFVRLFVPSFHFLSFVYSFHTIPHIVNAYGWMCVCAHNILKTQLHLVCSPHRILIHIHTHTRTQSQI